MKYKNLLMIIAIMFIANYSTAQIKGTFTDSRDGKTYKTVKIGTQTWMAENLAYKVGSGCWAYDNKVSNVAIYGYLYNWSTAKNVCPTGWHLPSDGEWTTLTAYLGGEEVAGGKLKSISGWKSPNNGASNSSGFTALAGGDRMSSGSSIYIGVNGNWWSSSSDNSSNAWNRGLFYYDIDLHRISSSKEIGLSVRCIKD